MSKLMCFWLTFLSCLGVASHNQAQSLVPDYPVKHIAASGDGSCLAVLGRTGQDIMGEITYFIDIIDAATLQIVSSVNIGTNQPFMLEISHNGRWLAYYVDYTELMVIDTVTGERSLLVGGGPVEVGVIDWSPADGRLAYSVGAGISIAQFYGDLPQASLSDEASPGLVYDLAWSHDGKQLASATYASAPSNPLEGTHNTQIWNESQMATETMLSVPSMRFPDIGGGLHWSPADETIALSRSAMVTIVDVNTGEIVRILFPPPEQNGTDIVWSPDGNQIAAGTLDLMWIWDVESGEIVEMFPVEGIADQLVWLPTFGIIHNGSGNGLYRNGELVTAPQQGTIICNSTEP